MRPRLATITLSSNQSISPSKNVTLIVGPNNVGKSAILTGINQELTHHVGSPRPPGSRPVESIGVEMPDAQTMMGLLSTRARLVPPGNYDYGTIMQDTYIFDNGAQIYPETVASLVLQSSNFGELAAGMVSFLGPEGRGHVLSSVTVPDLTSPQQGRSPLQILWSDRGLEKRIDEYMYRAFGKHLVVNRHAGQNVHLQIGVVDHPEPMIGDRTVYVDEILALPHLHKQGAGMLAFMGTIMTVATGNYDILLIDEPETFLHPPQARLLGEIVAEMSAENGLQVVAATHSDDFVQGVIAGSKANADVAIARITRPVDHENHAALIEPAAIKTLYTDPLLRFSRIMDGIFYKGVVLCEAESDCTYYSATLSHLEASEHLSSSDLLFAQCGGKHRLSKAHKSLSAAAVPTAVIADVDLLAEKSKFKDLFETMGGDFAAIEGSYNVLASSVREQKLQPRREDFLRAAVGLETGGEFLSATEVEQFREILKSESGWKQVKKKGEGSIDTGNPTTAFTSILAACAAVGLFVLKVGELERFHPEVGGNKQEWLRKVLEAKMHENSQAARVLLRDVRSWISSQQ